MQTDLIPNFSIGCLIELKFCEVSRKYFSNRFWKFQLSILKNKKVLFLKKNKIKLLSISKQISFVYWPNFQGRFWLWYPETRFVFTKTNFCVLVTPIKSKLLLSVWNYQDSCPSFWVIQAKRKVFWQKLSKKVSA